MFFYCTFCGKESGVDNAGRLCNCCGAGYIASFNYKIETIEYSDSIGKEV